MRDLILALAALAAAPAALAAPPPAAPPEAGTPIEPDRLAAAQRLMMVVFPAGTYEKLMDGPLRTIARAAAMAPSEQESSGAAQARASDPHLEERVRITMDVVFDEMKSVLAEEEPLLREAMARAYARRFTVADMTDLGVFFATPTGKKYVVQSLTLMEDPELLARMMLMEPRLMQALPRIMDKVMAAVAHLPPPPGDDVTS